MRYLKPIYKLVVVPADTQFEPVTVYSCKQFNLREEIEFCMDAVGIFTMSLETIHVGLNPLSNESD